MDAGAAIFFTDYSIGPAALGRALEERGLGSLGAPEHSHIPLSRASAFPQGGDLPKKYYDVMVVPAHDGDVLVKLPEFHAMVVEAGRDPATLPVTVFGVAEDADLIKRYRDAGVARLIFNLPSAKADEVLPVLDRCAALVQS